MSALDRMKFVVQDSRTGLYRLGPAAVSLGTIALNGSPIFRASRQIAQNLARRIEIGVNVAELSGFTFMYLCNFEGALAPKSFDMAGRTGPLHATGIGKALLSGMTDAQVDEYFAQAPQRFTPHTIVDRDSMQLALDETRSRGYSTEIEELAFGRACIAAPIRNRAGEIVAGISASGPLGARPARPAPGTRAAADRGRRRDLRGSRLQPVPHRVGVRRALTSAARRPPDPILIP